MDALLASPHSTNRGYTGHEHLDHLGLIHTNGRIYDPVIGRLLTPDPNVQQPNDIQSFHRYTYVRNNPLRFTEPSGFIFDGVESFVTGAVGALQALGGLLAQEPVIGYIRENPRIAAAIAISALPIPSTLPAATQAFLAVTQGFAAGMIASKGDIKQGLIGAESVGAFYGIGHGFQGINTGFESAASTVRHLGKTVAHGVVGGGFPGAPGRKLQSRFCERGDHPGGRAGNQKYPGAGSESQARTRGGCRCRGRNFLGARRREVRDWGGYGSVCEGV